MKNLTQQEFWYNNFDSINWYKKTYPFLNDFSFPPSRDFLETFYVNDMEERNLTPLKNLFSNYEFLFSYFLANYPENKNKFVGKNFFERSIENLPGAVEKTFKPIIETGQGLADIVGGIGSAFKNFWYIIIPVILILIYLMVKK